MRRFGSWSAPLLLFVLAVPAFAEEKPAPAPQKQLEYVYVELTGVEGREIAAVQKGLAGVEGVQSFAWTAEGTEAKVVREIGKAADATLLAQAKAAGAETAGVVPLVATTFTFEKKLHCGGCVGAVTKALAAVKGVKESYVPEEMTTVMVVYDSRVTKTADVEAALTAISKPAKASTK